MDDEQHRPWRLTRLRRADPLAVHREPDVGAVALLMVEYSPNEIASWRIHRVQLHRPWLRRLPSRPGADGLKPTACVASRTAPQIVIPEKASTSRQLRPAFARMTTAGYRHRQPTHYYTVACVPRITVAWPTAPRRCRAPVRSRRPAPGARRPRRATDELSR